MNKTLTLKIFSVCFLFAFLCIGCGGGESSSVEGSLDTDETYEDIVLPTEDPEEVVKDFYSLLSMGGLVSTREAFDYVDKGCAIDEEKFGVLIKEYPEGFSVKVLSSRMDEMRMLVDIEFLMPSSLGDPYTVVSTVPLLIDPLSNSWKIDFTGESEPDDTLTEGFAPVGSPTGRSLTPPHAMHQEND